MTETRAKIPLHLLSKSANMISAAEVLVVGIYENYKYDKFDDNSEELDEAISYLEKALKKLKRIKSDRNNNT